MTAEPLPRAHPSAGTLRALVGDDWGDVNRMIVRRLGSDVALVNQVAHHIIHNGGKRLRPLAVLLAARACGSGRSQDHVAAAAIIEFIHTATLLHDDVVDSSGLRRGQETANAVFGNQASVLVGDFLYSRSFQMMVELQEIRILDVLANATNTIAEGEVLQLMNCNNPDIGEADYMEVIYRKTAKLFEAGTRIGAILAKSRPRGRGAGRGRPQATARSAASSVSVAVGVRLFTRIPWRARSMAAARVKLSRPLLLVE